MNVSTLHSMPNHNGFERYVCSMKRLQTAFALLVVFWSLVALIALPLSLLAQSRTVSGKVSETGGTKALSGVKIIAKGTRIGTFSKKDGTYSIAVPAGSSMLVFEYVGFRKQEVRLTDASELNVQMVEDVLKLEELVVTAGALEQQKKALSYAVQDVKGGELLQSREVSIVNALSGKAAGVQVISSSGAAGASAFIRIRGASSMTGSNQPLFVVDGIPIDNSISNSESTLQGVAQSNRAMDINPNDVESVSVLKGAAAAALYGIRAASGVILITTKRGRSADDGSVSINFTSSVSLDQVNKLPELQSKFGQGLNGLIGSPISASAALRFRSWGPLLDTVRRVADPTYLFDNNGIIVGQSDPRTANGQRVTPYDNPGTFFRNGLTLNNTLTLSGGNNISTYFLSFGDSRSQGIIPNNTFDRTSIKLTADYRASDALKITGSATYIGTASSRIQQGSNTSGIMLGLMRTPITFDNSNGLADPVNSPDAYLFSSTGRQRTYIGGGGFDNPYFVVNKNPYRDATSRLIAFTEIAYTPLDWLSVTYRIGNDFYSDRRRLSYDINSASFPAGRVQEDNIFNNDFTSDLFVTLNQQFNDDLRGSLTLNHNAYSYYNYAISTIGSGFTISDFGHIANATNTQTASAVTQKRTMAVTADAKAEYKNWLFLNLLFRNEWSTTLPPASNSYQSYSASTSFVFSEALGIGNEVFSFGKLRASYAIVGKDAGIYSTTTPFGSIGGGTGFGVGDGWTNGVSFPAFGVAAFQPSATVGASVLRPERTSEIEAGIELKFFNNSFGLDVNYFNNVRSDQIFAVNVSQASGYNRTVQNLGEMINQGFEIQANARLVEVNDFSIDAVVNASSIRNTVTKLFGTTTYFQVAGFSGGQVGASIGSAYPTIFGGVWLRDANGNRVIDSRSGYPVVDPISRPIAKVDPDWFGSARLTVNWSGFSLTGLLDVKQGGFMWNGTRGAQVNYGMAKETENRDANIVFQGVVGEQQRDGSYTVTTTPNTRMVTLSQNWYLGNGGGFGTQIEDFVESTSWIRLREVSVSYNLPASLLAGSFLKRAGITLTGRNIWLSTPYKGVDPETSLVGSRNGQGLDYYQMPSTRSYVATLTLGF